MKIVLLILLLITLVYNITASIINKGIPESISATSYIYNNKYKKYYLFTFYCLLIGVGLLPIWISLSIEAIQCLAFISCVGIMFAGVTPFFNEAHHKAIHYTAGIMAACSYVL